MLSSVDAYGGATPAGAAGPYTVITGVVHGRLLPAHPDNAGIVDIANVPKDADGYIDYTTDVVILRPKTRGHRAPRAVLRRRQSRQPSSAMQSFIGGGSLIGGAAPDASFPSLLRAGYTVVWSGWQGNVAQTGTGATNPLGVTFPVATNGDGTPITGLSREEYIPDGANGGATASASATSRRRSTDRSEVVFTARQSWKGADGKSSYATPSVPVTNWSYSSNGNGTAYVNFTPPAAVPAPDGTIGGARRRHHLQLRLSREEPGRRRHRLRGGARPRRAS